jgi:hypothetical protein
MLNTPERFSAVEEEARERLIELLRRVPAIESNSIETNRLAKGADLIVEVEVGSQHFTLICEVKANGQPRYIHEAVSQLRHYLARLNEPATAILIAPYLSAASRELCIENGIGYLDFEGNTHIAFGPVFLERIGSDAPVTERREFNSLFAPKSSRVLRVLLRDPERTWRVADLAEEADVSLGHISNVRSALLEREWARVLPEGFRLTAANEVLDAWKSVYKPLAGREIRFYTTLHGSGFDEAVRRYFQDRGSKERVVLASFSAAQWIAPYGRTGSQYLYGNEAAVPSLERSLRLSSSLKGENVRLTVPKDDGIFRDSEEPAPGIPCTSAVQTYLDLYVAGERGREAAEHLRDVRLRWRS